MKKNSKEAVAELKAARLAAEALAAKERKAKVRDVDSQYGPANDRVIEAEKHVSWWHRV